MTDARRRMLDRVRAIISKTTANGCTEGEALAALTKARELMAAHDITEADLDVRLTGEKATILNTVPDDPYRIRRSLAWGVSKFTHTTTWCYSSGRVTFCGLASETQFAAWLLDTLQAHILKELKAYQKRRRAAGESCPRLVSASFVAGATSRISQRLRTLAAEVTTTGTALTVSRQALIDDAMAAAGIKLRTRRASSKVLDGGGYSAGLAAGDRAQFSRPVDGSNRPKLS